MKLRLAALAALLVFVLAAAAGAALPKKGTYRGESSQGLSVTIKVNEAQKVKSLKFIVRNNCGATRKPIEVTGPFKVKKRTGRFSASLSNDFGSLDFSGRFKNGKVSGQVRERLDDPLLGKCDTGKVTFTGER